MTGKNNKPTKNFYGVDILICGANRRNKNEDNWAMDQVIRVHGSTEQAIEKPVVSGDDVEGNGKLKRNQLKPATKPATTGNNSKPTKSFFMMTGNNNKATKQRLFHGVDILMCGANRRNKYNDDLSNLPDIGSVIRSNESTEQTLQRALVSGGVGGDNGELTRDLLSEDGTPLFGDLPSSKITKIINVGRKKNSARQLKLLNKISEQNIKEMEVRRKQEEEENNKEHAKEQRLMANQSNKDESATTKTKNMGGVNENEEEEVDDSAPLSFLGMDNPCDVCY